MSILVSSLLSAQKRTSLGCRAGIRTRACRTARRRTTIWAAPHLAELRRTLFYSRKWLPGEKGGTRWNGLIMLFDNWSDQDSIQKSVFLGTLNCINQYSLGWPFKYMQINARISQNLLCITRAIFLIDPRFGFALENSLCTRNRERPGVFRTLGQSARSRKFPNSVL